MSIDETLTFSRYEELNHPVTNEKFTTPVGFCTAYKFFAYPNNVRARISQFFVLPSHQRRGIGTQLYKAVVQKLRELPEVTDITGKPHCLIHQNKVIQYAQTGAHACYGQ